MAQDRTIITFDLKVKDRNHTFELTKLFPSNVDAVIGIALSCGHAAMRGQFFNFGKVGFRLNNQELFPDNTHTQFFMCHPDVPPAQKMWLLLDRNDNPSPEPVGKAPFEMRLIHAQPGPPPPPSFTPEERYLVRVSLLVSLKKA